MERRKEGNGLETFLEHWGLFLPITIVGIVASLVLSFFGSLSGTPWICFLVASMVLQLLGAALILYAKIPVYRSGRFFSFGVKSVAEERKGIYFWGCAIFLLGVVLSLCGLLSK
jgi:hypothetical protein